MVKQILPTSSIDVEGNKLKENIHVDSRALRSGLNYRKLSRFCQ